MKELQANRKYWIALFSQTGSELESICNILETTPDVVLTNNIADWEGRKDFCGAELQVMHHQDIFDELRRLDPTNVIITLHGFLRILPADICERFEIYNGHPAPIHLYPELKGKDKQEDLYKYKDKYPRIGCVVHRVTPILDDGKLVVVLDAPNNLTSIEDAYQTLKTLSFNSWIQFFDDYLPNKMSS